MGYLLSGYLGIISGMCGRFIQIVNPELIKVDFSELEVDDEALSQFNQSYNVAPTKDILTLLNTSMPRLTLFRWF